MLTARLRLMSSRTIVMGPGRAELLGAIDDAGSIAAAARKLEMSYTRALHLVAAMNRAFRAPVVRSAKGGRAHGGTGLTPSGQRVLALYRAMDARMGKAIAAERRALERLLRRAPTRSSARSPTARARPRR